jgi:hypothetical protein
MVAVKAELKARERLIADKDAALMMYQKQTQNHERSKQSQQVCHGFEETSRFLASPHNHHPQSRHATIKRVRLRDGPLRRRSVCMTRSSTSSSGRTRC